MADQRLGILREVLMKWCGHALGPSQLVCSSLDDFKDGIVLCRIYEVFQGRVPWSKLKTKENAMKRFAALLSAMEDDGVDVNEFDPTVLSRGDGRQLIDFIWLICLHYQIAEFPREPLRYGGQTLFVETYSALLLHWLRLLSRRLDISCLCSDLRDGLVFNELFHFLASHLCEREQRNGVGGDPTEPAVYVIQALCARYQIPALFSDEDLVSGLVEDKALLVYLSLLMGRNGPVEKHLAGELARLFPELNANHLYDPRFNGKAFVVIIHMICKKRHRRKKTDNLKKNFDWLKEAIILARLHLGVSLDLGPSTVDLLRFNRTAISMFVTKLLLAAYHLQKHVKFEGMPIRPQMCCLSIFSCCRTEIDFEVPPLEPCLQNPTVNCTLGDLGTSTSNQSRSKLSANELMINDADSLKASFKVGPQDTCFATNTKSRLGNTLFPSVLPTNSMKVNLPSELKLISEEARARSSQWRANTDSDTRRFVDQSRIAAELSCPRQRSPSQAKHVLSENVTGLEKSGAVLQDYCLLVDVFEFVMNSLPAIFSIGRQVLVGQPISFTLTSRVRPIARVGFGDRLGGVTFAAENHEGSGLFTFVPTCTGRLSLVLSVREREIPVDGLFLDVVQESPVHRRTRDRLPADESGANSPDAIRVGAQPALENMVFSSSHEHRLTPVDNGELDGMPDTRRKEDWLQELSTACQENALNVAATTLDDDHVVIPYMQERSHSGKQALYGAQTTVRCFELASDIPPTAENGSRMVNSQQCDSSVSGGERVKLVQEVPSSWSVADVIGWRGVEEDISPTGCSSDVRVLDTTIELIDGESFLCRCWLSVAEPISEMLKITVRGPDDGLEVLTVEPDSLHGTEGGPVHVFRFSSQQHGMHCVSVRWSDRHASGSPFWVNFPPRGNHLQAAQAATPPHEAADVVMTGDDSPSDLEYRFTSAIL